MSQKNENAFRCSSCLVVGHLELDRNRMMFFCTSCGEGFINPIAVGPWDERISAIERVGENVVSSYVISDTAVEERDINPTYAEFYRWLRQQDDLANRRVEREEEDALPILSPEKGGV